MSLCLKPCHERFDQGLWYIQGSDTDPNLFTVVVADALCEDPVVPEKERKHWSVSAVSCAVIIIVTCDDALGGHCGIAQGLHIFS